MARRSREEPPKGAPEWMVTYSDLVTLLFCFFIMLYAMSDVDVEKFQSVANSFSGNPNPALDFGGGSGVSELMGAGIVEMPDMNSVSKEALYQYEKTQNELEKAASDFKTYFEQKDMADKVEVKVYNQSIAFKFSEGVLYDSGKAVLKPDAFPILDLIGEEVLKSPGRVMRIEGHTDNVPIHTAQFPNNWYLSSARASSVATYYTDVKGLNPEHLLPIGYGEYHPIESNDTMEGRAKNRRVELYIMTEYYTDVENE